MAVTSAPVWRRHLERLMPRDGGLGQQHALAGLELHGFGDVFGRVDLGRKGRVEAHELLGVDLGHAADRCHLEPARDLDRVDVGRTHALADDHRRVGIVEDEPVILARRGLAQGGVEFAVLVVGEDLDAGIIEDLGAQGPEGVPPGPWPVPCRA